MAVKNSKPEVPEEEKRGAAEPAEIKREPWSGYKHFTYIGPSLPGGALKRNAVLIGSFAEIKAFLSPVLEKYPQAERLIFPVEKLGEQLKKVRTPGNIANKYYNDLVSVARADKEE